MGLEFATGSGNWNNRRWRIFTMFPQKMVTESSSVRRGQASSPSRRLLTVPRQNFAAKGQHESSHLRGLRVAMWDFSKVSLFPPDHKGSRSQQPPAPEIQPKLIVGATHDPLEHEADLIAERMIPSVASRPVRGGSAADDARRKHDAGSDAGQAAGGIAAPALVREVLSSPGEPLDQASRGLFESHLGFDLGSVRLHTGGRAAESARSLGARAYTVGSDVVFGRGQYQPQTQSGQRLLAHELAHVAQQRSLIGCGPAAHTIQRQTDTDQSAIPVPQLTQLVPGDLQPVAPGAGGLQPGGPGGAMNTGGFVDPSTFNFHVLIPLSGSGPGGWQESDCETIRFRPPFGFPPSFSFDVKTLAGCPLRNTRQGDVSARFAHTEAVDAANIAGIEVVGLLDDGGLSPSDAPVTFRRLMHVHFNVDGNRVNSC